MLAWQVNCIDIILESGALDALSKEEAMGFFDQIGEKAEMPKEKPSREARLGSVDNLGMIERISRNINWNEGMEKMIKENILIGNLEGAVDCCLKCGRSVISLLNLDGSINFGLICKRKFI